MSSSSWSDDLPDDVLLLIVKKVISGSDFASFSQVCSSWRSIAKQEFHPVLPGIITREVAVLCKNRFESLSKLKLGPRGPTIPSGFPSNKRKTPEKCACTRGLPLVRLPLNVVCGSHQGWILMKEPKPHKELVLMNPVTQVQFKLPYHYGTRFTFSANPMDESCCYIIASSDPITPLKCCKLRDVRWTDVSISDEKNASFGFVDAIYYRGKLYALRVTGELFVCDDITASPPTMNKLVNTPQYSPAAEAWELKYLAYRSPARFFLVESGQELLLVYCKDKHCLSAGLEVYRLDIGGLRWDRVANLGEHALFLGMNQPFSLSELDVRGIKGNHIYCIEESKNLRYTSTQFDDYYALRSDSEEDSRKEICVFSLEKSSIEYLTTEFPIEKPRGIWFTPQL